MDQKMHHGSEHHIVNGQNDVQPMSENLKTMIYMCIVYIYIFIYKNNLSILVSKAFS